jgi:acyl-CoA synthetase (AMP-forming)/AMP-acid ligase II
MIIRSPHSPVPLSGLRLTEFILAHAAENPRKPAIIDGADGRAVSYCDLATAIDSAAAGLVRHGVRRGDVIALASPNCAEFAIAFYAAVLAGAAISPVNPLAPAADMTRQLTHSGARWLITTAAAFEEHGHAACTAAGLGSDAVFVFGEATRAVPFGSLLDARPTAPAYAAALSPDDTAYLPYSSGTTGLPKGVMVTHRNMVANLCQIRAVHQVRRTDVVLAALPWFHIFGLLSCLNLGLREGATIVTMPPFEPRKFLRLVERYKVTRVAVVPPIVLALAGHPAAGDYDTSTLRLITSAAAPLSPDLARACALRLGCKVNQAYGMTEIGWTHAMPDDADDPDGIGAALPGTECRVNDPATGLDLPSGKAGELLVRGPACMRGYLNNPEATAAAVGPDGFVHTGDLVVADESGRFRIVGRLKEIIKYKGHQVAPAALEAILLRHPAVADAAVIGCPDKEAGEVPAAYVVARQPVSADDLMMFVARQVAPHEKVRRLEFTSEIPRSASGKILRQALADRERAPVIPTGNLS